MGQLDYIKSYDPVNLTPQGATGNPLEFYVQQPSLTWATPEQIAGNYWQMGPWTPAGIYEVNGAEFLQQRLNWASIMSNSQIVTVPDQPVDAGTYEAYGGTMKTGVYNQPLFFLGTTKQVAGSAPTTGVYTGFYGNAGDYEGCGL